jgi:hypothetical protein
LTDGDRVELLKRTHFQSTLPNIPRIPGYHVCWVSTTHPSDTPQGRLQLGYSYITPDEVPDFQFVDQKSADYPGVIVWREMVAMKIELHLYQLFMEELHHNEPLKQEETIYDAAVAAGEDAARSAKRGGRLRNPVVQEDVGDGTDGLGADRDAPNFCHDEMVEG